MSRTVHRRRVFVIPSTESEFRRLMTDWADDFMRDDTAGRLVGASSSFSSLWEMVSSLVGRRVEIVIGIRYERQSNGSGEHAVEVRFAPARTWRDREGEVHVVPESDGAGGNGPPTPASDETDPDPEIEEPFEPAEEQLPSLRPLITTVIRQTDEDDRHPYEVDDVPYHGIELLPIARHRGLPHTDGVPDANEYITLREGDAEYHLYPQVRYTPDGPRVVFYVAVNMSRLIETVVTSQHQCFVRHGCFDYQGLGTRRYTVARSEFVVGPHDLDDFRPLRMLDTGQMFFASDGERPFRTLSASAIQNFLDGNYSGYFSDVADANVEAVQDSQFWLETIGLPSLRPAMGAVRSGINRLGTRIQNLQAEGMARSIYYGAPGIRPSRGVPTAGPRRSTYHDTIVDAHPPDMTIPPGSRGGNPAGRPRGSAAAGGSSSGSNPVRPPGQSGGGGSAGGGSGGGAPPSAPPPQIVQLTDEGAVRFYHGYGAGSSGANQTTFLTDHGAEEYVRLWNRYAGEGTPPPRGFAVIGPEGDIDRVVIRLRGTEHRRQPWAHPPRPEPPPPTMDLEAWEREARNAQLALDAGLVDRIDPYYLRPPRNLTGGGGNSGGGGE